VNEIKNLSDSLVAIYYFRLIMFAARVIVSPKAAVLRLAPMSDADAGLI
jgi:hypothetical protein